MASLTRLGALGVLVLACSGETDGLPETCDPAGNPAAVDVCDSFFAPDLSPIQVGSTVTWTWRGSLQHNVTFEDGEGSSGTKGSGAHDRSFADPGTFRYRCTIHSTSFESGMVGRVTVQ
jgi:plastocyanin